MFHEELFTFDLQKFSDYKTNYVIVLYTPSRCQNCNKIVTSGF